MADFGTGATVAFGTSAFSAEITSIAVNEAVSRVVRDVSHLGTTGARLKKFGDLVDHGSLTLEFFWDPDVQPPIAGAAETVTITFPLPAGGVGAATLAGTAFVSEWQWTVPLEEEMVASCVVTWDGATDPVFTAST